MSGRGTSCFTIDRRPLQAALQQVEANLLQARAQLRQAEADLARDRAQPRQPRRGPSLREARGEGVVAREQYDQIHTSLEAMGARVQANEAAVGTPAEVVAAAKAALDSARLQLGYTDVRSPLDGRTGNLLTQPGDHSRPTTCPSSSDQADPAHPRGVRGARAIARSEQTVLGRRPAREVKPGAAQHDGPWARELRRQHGRPDDGHDQAQGDRPERRRRMWPGEFVSVVVTLTRDPTPSSSPSRPSRPARRDSTSSS